MTQEALKASIEKWERNAVAEKPHEYLTGPSDFPLCNIYWTANDCRSCPVFEKTGMSDCKGTPYSKCYDALFIWNSNPSSDKKRAAAHEAARREVEFLRGLLK